MKKLYLMSAFALMAVAANAAGTIVNTSCGKQVMTCSIYEFETSFDFVDYLDDLNETYCGTRGGYTISPR